MVDVGRAVRVATVDNFQGEEAKIIILSLTRNNSSGDIGEGGGLGAPLGPLHTCMPVPAPPLSSRVPVFLSVP